MNDLDYAHIGNRVKYLPQNLFVPNSMTLDEAFSLYGVDYDGLVTFDTKFPVRSREDLIRNGYILR